MLSKMFYQYLKTCFLFHSVVKNHIYAGCHGNECYGGVVRKIHQVVGHGSERRTPAGHWEKCFYKAVAGSNLTDQSNKVLDRALDKG